MNIYSKIVEQNSRKPKFWLIWRPKNLGLCAYLLHTYRSSSNELINQVSSEFSGNFSGKETKTHILTYFGQKGPENLGHSGHFSHMHTHTHPRTQARTHTHTHKHTRKYPHWKIRKKNQNSTCTTFWAILLYTFKPIVGNIGWELGEPIRFEKKVDGQIDGRRTVRHRISSAVYVTSGVKMVENTDTEIWQNPKPIPRVLLGGMRYMIGHY